MGGGSSSSNYDRERIIRMRRENQAREHRRLQELGRQVQLQIMNQNTPQGVQNTHYREVQIQNNSSNMPADNQLSAFTKAAQEFLNKQEVKRLAREKNLTIHGKLIKSKVSIDMASITFRQDSDDSNVYNLSGKYSASELAKISVYYCATQITNQEGVPTYFTIPPELPSAVVTNVDKGKNKLFSEFEASFDIEKYEGMPLFNNTYNYYPLVITIEPRASIKVDKDGISDSQTLITYGVLRIDKTTNLLQVAPIQQVLIAFEMAFLLQQIYGINDTLEERKDGDGEIRLLAGEVDNNLEDGQLGVICLSEEKNTVVMPGGHLGVCKDGATAISKQTTPDGPVGRHKVRSFVPLNISSIKQIEEKSSISKTSKVKDDESKSYNYGFEI